MFDGYLTYGGSEIINIARTSTYLDNANVTWFIADDKFGDLAEVLGDKYTTPLNDEPDWFDPDDPDTWDFYGFYPLSVTGVEDSTRTATVSEAVGDGGSVSLVRAGTKTIVVQGLLVGAAECNVAIGMSWLKNALAGGGCSGGSCDGDDVCMLNCIPGIDDTSPNFPNHCLDDYLRTFHNVTVTNGPVINTKLEMSIGGEAWDVTFTMVVGNPHAWGPEVVITDRMWQITTPNVAGGLWNAASSFGFDLDCAQSQADPLQDPTCDILIPPPGAPTIDLFCYDPPTNWDRYTAQVPKQFVGSWMESVPVLKMYPLVDTRLVRVRFFPDPFETFDPDAIDPCGFCGDIVTTFMPTGSEWTLDGVGRKASSMLPGGRRASGASLIFSTDGGPAVWPSLSCGMSYIMAIDVPQGTPVPGVSLSLYSRDA
jgi:hypothetical protein